jgi:hypothetical protein
MFVPKLLDEELEIGHIVTGMGAAARRALPGALQSDSFGNGKAGQFGNPALRVKEELI